MYAFKLINFSDRQLFVFLYTPELGRSEFHTVWRGIALENRWLHYVVHMSVKGGAPDTEWTHVEMYRMCVCGWNQKCCTVVRTFFALDSRECDLLLGNACIWNTVILVILILIQVGIVRDSGNSLRFKGQTKYLKRFMKHFKTISMFTVMHKMVLVHMSCTFNIIFKRHAMIKS